MTSALCSIPSVSRIVTRQERTTYGEVNILALCSVVWHGEFTPKAVPETVTSRGTRTGAGKRGRIIV